jgi:hypothetical protein
VKAYEVNLTKGHKHLRNRGRGVAAKVNYYANYPMEVRMKTKIN